jgi:hypothetical protein
VIPYLLNLIDIITTLYALDRGAVELNPIMAAVIGVHPLLFVFVKAVLVIPIFIRLEKASRFVYYVVTVLFAIVVMNNLIVCFSAQIG